MQDHFDLFTLTLLLSNSLNKYPNDDYTETYADIVLHKLNIRVNSKQQHPTDISANW